MELSQQGLHSDAQIKQEDFVEKVILVDESDREIGEMEKLEVHQKVLLHRAFSVFVFNEAGELMIQRRALSKYHSSGLWSNTCCGHPRPGEETLDAARRRLQEEMRISCPLRELFSFVYQAELDHGLSEYEFDHVFIGNYNAAPDPDPEEAMDWRFISLEKLKKEVSENPEGYTFWLREILDKVAAHMKKE